MNIVIFTTGLDRAGAETQVRDLALKFSQRDHTVNVVSLANPKALIDDFVNAGVVVHTLGMDAKRKTVSSFVKAIGKARQLIRVLKPDIVHSHMVHANLFCRVAAALGGWPPLICTAHNIDEGGRARDWAYRLTNRFAQLNTTISHAATDRFVGQGVFPTNTLTVHNGIDVSRFQTRDVERPTHSEFRWIAIGRLHEQKDYPTLLAALADIEVGTLDIYGEGPLENELVALTRDLGLENRVRFNGTTDGIADILPNYDGFVLSSAWEGFGLVVAEAMACALPVVVTRSGGPQEILGESATCGFLVAPRAAKELSLAMSRMMALTSAERSAMGNAGRERIVDQFGLESVVTQWLNIYTDLTNQESPL